VPPSRLDFRDLKRRVTIEHVLAERGLLDRFHARGDSLVGPCPFHGGDSQTAFVASRPKNLWYCFTHCRAGGDVVELVRRLDDSGYRETARYLARIAGDRDLPTPPSQPPFTPFTATLRLDPHAPFLIAKGIRPDTARAFDAGLYRGRGFLEGCLGVRLHDAEGNPLGYAGRVLDPQRARQRGKWKFPARLPKRALLFNYHRIRSRLGEGVVLVEDPWSVMRLAQIDVPSVALLGTTLSLDQQALLRPSPQILLMLDGDSAGQLAAKDLTRTLGWASVGVVHLPRDTDPDQLTDGELLAAYNLFRQTV